jgi:hypothetical protein
MHKNCRGSNSKLSNDFYNCSNFNGIYTEYTQKNGAVSVVFTIETAPFFCVYTVLVAVIILCPGNQAKAQWKVE